MFAQPILQHSLTANKDSPVILYLHGFLGCREDWDDIAGRLGDRFSHLRLDLPGHRMSPHTIPEEYYTMPHCAELVVNLLDRLQIRQCHLVAYSMGGRLGLYLLTHNPRRFSKAVIESASPGLKTEAERTARRHVEQQVRHQLEEHTFDEFLTDWYNQPLFQTLDKTDPRFAAMLECRRQHDPAALALSVKHMGTSVMPPLWNRLPDLDLPVLFVAGEKDARFRALADEMANLCPHGRTGIIRNAGHNTHFECPAEFCREITQFLSQGA